MMHYIKKNKKKTAAKAPTSIQKYQLVLLTKKHKGT